MCIPLRMALVIVVGTAFFCLSCSSSPGGPPENGTFLVNVGDGQLPPDTGMDDKTTPEIVGDIPELGTKSLKVAFAKGDSFGGRTGANKNWTPFDSLRFDAWNPSNGPVNLVLVVKHDKTTNYQTRVQIPIKLKPGKNEVKIGIGDMTNVNGTAADLANVERWYIADEEHAGPTVYFGNIVLHTGETAPPSPGVSSMPQSRSAPVASMRQAPHASANPPSGAPTIGYRVKGTLGGHDVDVTVTPFNLTEPIASPPAAMLRAPVLNAIHGDPARLARLKARKMPPITMPVMFDTPDADAILTALEVFPPDSPWNLDVSSWPVRPNSKNMIALIGADKPLRCNMDMGFILIPPNQKKVDVKLTDYARESDQGPFPVPDSTPIEGWPAEYLGRPKVTLEDVQRNALQENGDRHGLVVDPTNRMLYEFYKLHKTDSGWQASQASIFDLKTNVLRPEGWTSADAAGLPIFPAVVRYDELRRGIVEHAMRVTVVKTKRDYVYPAQHFASSRTDDNLPRMGERIRLRSNFDVSGFSAEVEAILKGLKKYGMFVADNGLDWAISVAPDPRITPFQGELRKIKGSDFEVVEPPAGYEPNSARP